METNTTKVVSTNDLLSAKVVSMSVLGIASFVIGVSPIKLTRLFKINTTDSENNLLISLLLCFGGGVLLFTTFIHLQPEVRESFEYLLTSGRIPVLGEGIPLSELVFCFGFFFVYMMEELVHLFLHKKLNHDALHRSLSVSCPKKENLFIPRVNLIKDDTSISCISTSNKELLNSQTTVNFVSSKHDHNHMHMDDNIKNSFSGLLAVLALSFHAVFEGLAVGLEKDVQKVWYLFAAIATHKLVIAFCVGIELVSSRTKTLLIVIYIGTFAIVTPLGIGAGIALSERGTSEIDVTSVILQGMAAGTLLYVVFFEVLARERSNRHSGVWQLMAIIAGFAVMFSLQFATGHEHSHDHSHSQEESTLPGISSTQDHTHFS